MKRELTLVQGNCNKMVTTNKCNVAIPPLEQQIQQNSINFFSLFYLNKTGDSVVIVCVIT